MLAIEVVLLFGPAGHEPGPSSVSAGV